MEEVEFSKPAIYSPKFSVLTSRQVREAHRPGIQVIPWTVNEQRDIQGPEHGRRRDH